MNENILDDTLVDDLRWSLEPNEKIIWEGSPKRFGWPSHLENYFRTTKSALEAFSILIRTVIIGVLFLFLLLIVISVLILMNAGLRYFSILFIIGYLGITAFRYIKRSKTKYTITNQRIIFQLWNSKKQIQHYEIPFNEIKSFTVTEKEKDYGIIFLVLKNTALIKFNTKDLENGGIRHQPTLEYIDNIKEVSHYIELGIQGKL